MKEWFKYEFGYVNLTDEDIYLTHTGNWSETEQLPEKTNRNTRKGNFRRGRIIVFFLIAICLFLAAMLHNLAGNSASLLLLLGLPIGGFKLYQYLKSDMSLSFKIPLIKLKSVVCLENQAELLFENGDGEEETIRLAGVEEKGMKLLQTLLERT